MLSRRLSTSLRIFGALLIAVTSYNDAAFGQAAAPPPPTNPTETKDSARWGGNLLHNGSFEDDDGWSRVKAADLPGDALESGTERDDQIHRTGGFSIRLSGTPKTTRWFGVESEPIPVRPGNSYRINGWIRTDGVQPVGDQFVNSNLYVQFRDRTGTIILNNGRSPVRATDKVVGTNGWTEVSLLFNAPQFAEFARVGCAMTCSGTAWFDDLGLFEAKTQDFDRKETARFVLFYLDGDAPSDEVTRGLEKFLESTETLLGVKRKELVRYFKYPDEMKKLAMTGNRSPSHSEGTDIHTTSWDDRVAVADALMKPVGSAPALLGKGLAIYCATLSRDGDVHENARKMAKAGAMPSIIPPSDPTTVQVLSSKTQDALYGSFVGWLIQNFGVSLVKQVYAYPSPADAVTKMPARFSTVYQMTLEDAERLWREFLVSDKSKP